MYQKLTKVYGCSFLSKFYLKTLNSFRFKKYFGYLNLGRKGQQHDIFAYNGGLFVPDEILDRLKINDELLYKHTLKLSNYDFESEVSVNILGHIFEHSLNDLEEIQDHLTGKTTAKSKTKRKKDGVFYTPKYITKYIVDKTVGKLCRQKKIELRIEETEYEKERKGRQKTILKKLNQKLETYREWLLGLTVCDPACGSGAFLNQALEFLIAEHRYIDELQAQLFDTPMVLREVENKILENNLYGVDLNEESVEIAKLSLWLRTAQKGRKLTSLNQNLKYGNSLIDDPEVGGEKAFNWQDEFPEIFRRGGFDVVIGNPPYVRQELLSKNNKQYFQNAYKVANWTADLYVYFYEVSINILKQNGLVGLITPNKFYKTKYGKELRQYLRQYEIIELIDFFELKIFQDASTDSQILILNKNRTNSEKRYFSYVPIKSLNHFRNNTYIPIKINAYDLKDDIWIFNSPNDLRILNKMRKNSISLKNYTNNGILSGIKTGLNEAFIIDEKTKNKIIEEDSKSAELIKPYTAGTDIDKYSFKNSNRLYFINTYFDLDIKAYRGIYNWLLMFDEKLKKRQDKGVHHFNLRACSYYHKFDSPKIIYIHTAVDHKFYYDEGGHYVNNSCYLISNSDKFLSVWLNSKIFAFYKKLNFVAYGNASTNGRAKLDYNKMVNVPVPRIEKHEKKPFIEKANKMLELSKELQDIINQFLNLLQAKFSLEKPSRKLQNWHDLEFSGFLKELQSLKLKLPLSEQAEWLEYFNAQKTKAQNLKAEILKTDRTLDQLVYELYELTPAEIAVVEAATLDK